jgi:hypothetical protein
MYSTLHHDHRSVVTITSSSHYHVITTTSPLPDKGVVSDCEHFVSVTHNMGEPKSKKDGNKAKNPKDKKKRPTRSSWGRNIGIGLSVVGRKFASHLYSSEVNSPISPSFVFQEFWLQL